ncbi:putative bifunctional diguanylate cyclase/phosphodiesterase [Scleromatobacter humisilvae]|uniref:EAL domain-containing protein n=1 Tax=Scleromatobacter humisilvae TaxID=2897159 RepID=A0A9X1YEK5_9BURK|nr:EAL domain-containing protein [Scleromatobacter humisilvae]MCK9684461.1 EAL domain-containing protein [Scleromatobacter humisilvae]
MRSEMLAVYSAGDRDSAQIRAAHLHSVVRLTPFTMTANIGNGALVVWAYRDDVPMGMLVWLALLYALCVFALLGWWRGRHRVHAMASPAAIRHANVHANLLALVWAALPILWFAHAAPQQQLLVVAMVTGMLAAGAFVLSPLPVAAVWFVVIFASSGVIACVLTGDRIFAAVAVLQTIYALVVIAGTLATSRKATALLQSQAEAKRQERMMAVLLHDFEQNAAEALWETGLDGCVAHHSPRLATLLGLDEALLRERPFVELLAQAGADVARLRAAMDAERPFKELRLSAASSHHGPRHWSINGKRLVDDDGRTAGWRGVVADVTEQVMAQERLQHLAHTDSLTGLANRFTLHGALRAAIVQERLVALLVLDLDHFKLVNDTLGHAAGDQLLQTVAARLLACRRAPDLVARLGGDEFALLVLEDAGVDVDVDALSQRLIDVLEEPVELGGRSLRASASIGVARRAEGDISADDLLVHADIALYAAKKAGRARYAAYSSDLGDRNRRSVMIEQELRQAIQRGQLELHWQPKVDIESSRVVGVEVLLRWEHPQLGHVAPIEFIPIAEKSGVIREIGAWVLREACRVAVASMPGLGISVNVSPTQLHDDAFIACVREALAASRLDPFRLELEITESVFIDDVDGALQRLHALRALGVRVALDDFGTGYSSLAYLRRFPFDTLKIDRAFVNELMNSIDTRAIVQMISQLAVTLNMRTVAEGVESAAQLAAVSSVGCDEVQGWLVSPACPLDEFLVFWKGWLQRPLALVEQVRALGTA